MEISALEIKILCDRIKSSIQDYHLSGLYSMEGGLILRLSHESKAEVLIAVSTFATWITKKKLSLDQATDFVRRSRDLIERAKIVNVEQVDNERVAKYSLKDRSGRKFNLYAEFFSHGNQILTEHKEAGDLIIEVSRPQKFKHRSLFAGQLYALPPARGLSLLEVSSEILSRRFEEERAGPLSSVKWFGREIATSRKFVEEIFFRSSVDPNTPLSSLQKNDVHRLAENSQKLVSELQQSDAGYMLIPVEIGQNKLTNVKDRVDIDVCPIVLASWREAESAGRSLIVSLPSLGECLDEAQVMSVMSEKKRKASGESRAKILEIESAIQKQVQVVEMNKSRSEQLRSLAVELMRDSNSDKIADVRERLLAIGLIQNLPEKPSDYQFTSEPRSFLSTFLNSQSLASRLFDEAKNKLNTNLKLENVIAELETKKQELIEVMESTEERTERRSEVERRPREWFERYRWFLTSRKDLVIGGRDSTSNSIVINKYASPNDLVFHADLHGSPFFVLKILENNKATMGNTVENEVAQATVSFSRAWKDQIASADAYWVYPHQIKKSPPSGQYLPRGSFFIEGKKNFVKHLRVELAVGLIRYQEIHDVANRLFSGEPRAENNNPEEKDYLAVMCGPEKSVGSNSIANVKIAHGKERGSSIARSIKQKLVSKLTNTADKEMAKRIPLDDFIRVLPSGSFKLVAETRD